MTSEQRRQLLKYRDVIAMWMRGYDTASIAQHLEIPEHLAARWVCNFREISRT